MLLASAELLARAQGAAQQVDAVFPARGATAECLSAAVAGVPRLAEQLVRQAVFADRQAGVSWTRIGACFKISGEAARSRFGRKPPSSRPESGGRAPVVQAATSGAALLQPTLDEVVRETGASVSLVYRLSTKERVLRLALVSGVPVKMAALWARLPLGASGPVAEAVREQRLVRVASQTELVRRYPRASLVMPYDMTLAAVPIPASGEPWGALVLIWPGSRPEDMSVRDGEVLAAARDRMGTLLEHAAECGWLVPPGNPVYMPASPPSRMAGPAEALAAVDFVHRLSEGCIGLGHAGRITFVSPTAADLVDEDVADLRGALLWEALPWLEDPVLDDRYRAAVIGRQPTSLTALTPAGRRLDLHLTPDASGINLSIVPSRSTTPPAPSGRGHSERSTAPPAGGLYELMHLAATLTEAITVQDVVELAADHIMPAFHAQGFVVSVAEAGRLRIVGHRGYHPEALDRLDQAPFRDQTAPTMRALATRTPLFFATPDEIAELNADIPHLTHRAAWAFLPLIVSSRPVGCCVVSYDQPRPFTPDERAVLTSLAGLIAQALDRARQYDTTNQLAHSLQTGLLPTTLPTVPGLDVAARYLPATHDMEIGGDFYDLIRLDDTTVAATIGDVQGHNVNAAALMGQVRTAVHATAGAPPSEVLTRTNRLPTDLDPDLFTSCLYTQLDLKTHRAHLATAGHPPPLLRHPDGHTDILHLPRGLLLGIDPTTDYQTTELPLPPDSVLAFYTDGLIETPDTGLSSKRCKRFGVEGQIRLLVRRPSRVMSKAWRARFQRVVQRLRPVPVGSRDITAT
ncbi:PP2C family protein-serine/threonine phosphatase [Streptomyces sp. 1222.5]|uniref:PP2C family protein-serine/threonine phosphatase n=1 Tax=Streptomyces sp. 1222.5 TaxID=1881026 RepID=UPI003EBBD741